MNRDRLHSNKPIIACDIDGTVGDYHKHFTRFAEQWTGRTMPGPQDINPGLPLHKHLGMSKATYRECKLAYRQGGMKRSMPVYPGSPEAIRDWRKMGSEVWITTTRPYLRLDNIDPDTRHFLRRNGIQYDGILYGADKYRKLVSIVGADRIIMVLDDLPEMIDQAQGLGLPTFMKDQPYNQHYHHKTKVFGWWSATTFRELMEAAITEYKEKHK
jgi:hypothetical protein